MHQNCSHTCTVNRAVWSEIQPCFVSRPMPCGPHQRVYSTMPKIATRRIYIAHYKGKYSPHPHGEQRQQQHTKNKQHTSWTVNGTVKDAPKGWSSPGTPMGAGV